MNPRHARFAEGLARGLTGKAAAMAAGYAERSAKVTASKLRRDPCVQAEVSRIQRGQPLPAHRTTSSDLSPLGFLLSLMRDPSEPVSIRLRAAKVAAQYAPNPFDQF